MALMGRKSDEQKEAERIAREQAHAAAQQAWAEANTEKAAKKQAEHAAREEAQAVRTAHVQALTKWEYQVKRIGEDKQKGILGSTRMEQILNSAGNEGWELVTINEERATFKRPLPSG